MPQQHRGTCHPLGGQTEGQGSTGKCNAPHVGERPCLVRRLRDVEFVVDISRCRAPLHRSTTQAHRHAADVELYSSTALYSALQRSTSLQLYSALHSTSSTPSLSTWAGALRLYMARTAPSVSSARRKAIRPPACAARAEGPLLGRWTALDVRTYVLTYLLTYLLTLSLSRVSLLCSQPPFFLEECVAASSDYFS